jgi:flagellar hook-associated protein 3 FlgL
MRVTNQIITRSAVSRLQQNLQGMDRARDQVSTGRRIRMMSDDPTAASEVVRIGSSMRAIEQFRRNIRVAEGRGAAEENVLDRLGNLLGRGMELAVQQASSTSSSQTRVMAKAEVDQLIAAAVDLGNTKFGGDYLFGGTRGGEAPFALPATAADPFSRLVDGNGDPVNPSGSIQVEIADGRYVSPNHNGTEVFLDTNALQALRDLSTALGNNDVAGINSSMATLQSSFDQVQTLIGTQGARTGELIEASDSLDSLQLSMEAFRSDLRDVEVEKAMLDLVGRQTLYQAAMAATTRVLGLSLADYL